MSVGKELEKIVKENPDVKIKSTFVPFSIAPSYLRDLHQQGYRFLGSEKGPKGTKINVFYHPERQEIVFVEIPIQEQYIPTKEIVKAIGESTKQAIQEAKEKGERVVKIEPKIIEEDGKVKVVANVETVKEVVEVKTQPQTSSIILIQRDPIREAVLRNPNITYLDPYIEQKQQLQNINIPMPHIRQTGYSLQVVNIEKELATKKLESHPLFGLPIIKHLSEAMAHGIIDIKQGIEGKEELKYIEKQNLKIDLLPYKYTAPNPDLIKQIEQFHTFEREISKETKYLDTQERIIKMALGTYNIAATVLATKFLFSDLPKLARNIPKIAEAIKIEKEIADAYKSGKLAIVQEQAGIMEVKKLGIPNKFIGTVRPAITEHTYLGIIKNFEEVPKQKALARIISFNTGKKHVELLVQRATEKIPVKGEIYYRFGGFDYRIGDIQQIQKQFYHLTQYKNLAEKTYGVAMANYKTIYYIKPELGFKAIVKERNILKELAELQQRILQKQNQQMQIAMQKTQIPVFTKLITIEKLQEATKSLTQTIKNVFSGATVTLSNIATATTKIKEKIIRKFEEKPIEIKSNVIIPNIEQKQLEQIKQEQKLLVKNLDLQLQKNLLQQERFSKSVQERIPKIEAKYRHDINQMFKNLNLLVNIPNIEQKQIPKQEQKLKTTTLLTTIPNIPNIPQIDLKIRFKPKINFDLPKEKTKTENNKIVKKMLSLDGLFGKIIPTISLPKAEKIKEKIGFVEVPKSKKAEKIFRQMFPQVIITDWPAEKYVKKKNIKIL